MKARQHKKNGNPWRQTFREIVDASRRQAARQAWARAKTASALRRAMHDRRRHNAARRLSHIKHAAVARAVELAPEQVRVTLDTDFHVGLLSVRFIGGGRLHLPAASRLKSSCDAVYESRRTA